MLDDLEKMLHRTVAKRTMMALVDAIRSHLDEHPELRRELWALLGALRQPGTRRKSEPAVVYAAPRKNGRPKRRVRQGKKSQVILAYIAKVGAPLRAADVSKGTGIRLKSTGTFLRRLTKQGKLKQPGRGLYAAP